MDGLAIADCRFFELCFSHNIKKKIATMSKSEICNLKSKIKTR